MREPKRGAEKRPPPIILSNAATHILCIDLRNEAYLVPLKYGSSTSSWKVFESIAKVFSLIHHKDLAALSLSNNLIMSELKR